MATSIDLYSTLENSGGNLSPVEVFRYWRCKSIRSSIFQSGVLGKVPRVKKTLIDTKTPAYGCYKGYNKQMSKESSGTFQSKGMRGSKENRLVLSASAKMCGQNQLGSKSSGSWKPCKGEELPPASFKRMKHCLCLSLIVITAYVT